jgi:uncharacterized protein YndB with AHSA1/START domain
MNKEYIAQAEATINVPVAEVWDALVNPEKVKEYMFGTTAVSNWQKGSPIAWKGEYQGKPYEDKGEIIEIEPEKLLVVTHYSPLSGAEDVPENYHILRYELTAQGSSTGIVLTQDNCKNEEEKEQFSKNWQMMLDGLKKFLEK